MAEQRGMPFWVAARGVRDDAHEAAWGPISVTARGDVDATQFKFKRECCSLFD